VAVAVRLHMIARVETDRSLIAYDALVSTVKMRPIGLTIRHMEANRVLLA
jgi:hypothetical protein